MNSREAGTKCKLITKKPFGRTSRVLFGVLSLFAVGSLHAGHIVETTLQFNGEGTFVYESGFEDGFTWQNTVKPDPGGDDFVRGHYDYGTCDPILGLPCEAGEGEPPFDKDASNWLGTDITQCQLLDATENPTGETVDGCGSPIRISRVGGGKFDALSVVFMAGTISSSKGGHESGVLGYLVNLDGDAWTGVDWIEIDLADVGQPVGIDDLEVSYQVPEPTSIALLGVGLLALMFRSASGNRRRCQAPSEPTRLVS